MNIRSDLAMELTTDYQTQGLDENISLTEIKIDAQMSKRIGKPAGEYVTIESRIVAEGMLHMYNRLSEVIADSLKKLIGTASSVFVVGLGNPGLTADALGSKVLKNITVTRNICSKGKGMPVELSGFCPSVMGVTGIESYDIISGIVEKIKPDLVIAVDSLASAAVPRLASAFQICSSGITPGSGVSNHKKRLDKNSLGVRVISVGVPMVVYGDIIVSEALKNLSNRQNILENMETEIASLIVTPKEVDILVEDCGKIIANAINIAVGLNIT